MLFAFVLVAAACGGSENGSAAGSGSSNGNIVISGSSTVEPISIIVAEEFKKTNPDVNTSVSGPGTGDGFKLFCSGDADIADASRTIRESEAQDCESNGIEFVELKVGIDGIAVMSGPRNPIECLSFPDLYSLVGPESIGFSTWADANNLNSEVGGAGDLPDAELAITGPGEESGTFASFIEIALEDLAEERGQDATTRPDYQSSANDNVIIENISGSDTSFGWVGFAFAEENKDIIKVISISEEEGGECITPTPETIADNTYPISRDLFIYVNTINAASNPALVEFIDSYMDFGLNTAVKQAKYVPLDSASLAETQSAWSGR